MIRRAAKRVISRLSANDYQTLNRIELDRERLLANVAFIKKRHLDQAIIPVLKANAYGHGLPQIAKLLNEADCAFIAVDGYFEAASIRDITRHRILVMGYIKPQNARLLDTRKCSFVVQDSAGLEALGRLNRPVNVHMELNTGMYRLGLEADEIDAYLDVLNRYPQLRLEGVMTHLADADNAADDSYTEKQTAVFDDVISKLHELGLRPPVLHVAQTAGSTKARSHYANAIRLGIGLYGVNPLQPSDRHYKDLAGLQPVLTLKSTIIRTYELQKGDRVSYNGIFTAPKKMRIAILPMGYYEGLPRELSNRGCVTAADGRQLRIVGRVCMNHTIIDISGTDLAAGDEVTVISNNPDAPNSVQSASLTYDLFSYGWLANLASSVRRVIV